MKTHYMTPIETYFWRHPEQMAGRASGAYHQMSYLGFSAVDRDGALLWYTWSEWAHWQPEGGDSQI